MCEDNDEYTHLEKFYVYRSLHSDESWGAVFTSSDITKLPNIAFGMRVFAQNEKEAIGKAKMVYDRVHALDSEKENVRRFAAAALKYFIATDIDEAIVAEKAMKHAIKLNEEYVKHFNRLEDKDE